MDSRLALMTAAALGCALVLATPALSQAVIDGKKYGIEPQAGTEYGTAAEGTESQAAPKQAAPPPPLGCPYRDRKLDLIV